VIHDDLFIAIKMKNTIPKIKFHSANPTVSGFEIIPLEKIANNKKQYDVDPESPHQLKFYNLIYITEGMGTHFIDFDWYPIASNHLIYLAKEQVNAFKFTQGLKGYCIIFTEDYFIHGFSSLPHDFVMRLFNPQLFSPILKISEPSELLQYLDLLNKEFRNSSAFNQQEILKSLFTIFLSKAEQLKVDQTNHIKDKGKMGIFQQFFSLLESSYTMSRSADYYARELAISYKHLNAICKELTCKTAKGIINNYIILQAKRNLINTAKKSSEIAYLLGFDDPTNFTKYFKNHTGLTPNLFKKSFFLM